MNQTFNTAAAAHASLGDYVFEDRNANGVQDSGEAGIAGVTVELLDAAGAVVATTITGSAGAYRFTGLVPGTYSTRFVTPDGYVPTVANQGSDDAADSDAVGGVTQQVTLASGEFNGTLDAGFYRPASLGDYVFEDRNANGVQDSGEAGIAGVTVELLDATGAVVATTITGSAGAYRFTGLVPGTYSTRFVTPDGYVPTVANQGSDDAADSDAVGGVTQQVTLASGEFNGTLDAGFYRPASLGDYVFEDRNANGIQDSGEAGIAGVTVELLDATGAVVATTTTGSAGAYMFSSLVPGEYSVHFVTPFGYVPTVANQGSDDAKDSDANSDGYTQQITLLSGQHNSTVDAGLYLGISSPGVRTPGFWKQNGWQDFWDGDASAPKQAGKAGFANGDILYQTYGSAGVVDPVGGARKLGILIGDFNKNGKTDAGEVTIFYTQSEALTALNAADSAADARFILDRALVATWLNYLAGNPLTDPANNPAIFDAKDAVTQGITWLQRHSADENGDGMGDGSLSLSASSWKVAASSAAWNSTANGITGGETIKNWLDEYNNDGTLTYNGVKTVIAVDDSVWG
ncbi:SdrD B-like domain-containing protein [Siccirubricoccus deserti]